MPGVKRTEAQISGARIAAKSVAEAGNEVRKARKRRHRTQQSLADAVGISRASLAAIETSKGGGAPLGVWFAIAQALGRYLRFEFARDPLSELVDAGHLAIQELVIGLAKAAGWELAVEALSRA